MLWRGGLWLPRRELRHTLPAERDAFIGRDEALDQLAQRFVGGARLVSLLGIGGTGKTRLALRFGWQWLGDYPGGVWFCDLSAARGLDGIYYAVAQGLELPLGRADPVAQIGAALAGRGACLVILDNFEQVAQHAESSVGRWLQQAAQARFIVTSRELLGIVGEHTLAIAPLPAAEAAALFVRRASDAGREFAASVEEQTAVGLLVELLDGLPLAIELAAARVRVMQPRALLARMSERFKLLTSSGGGRTGRHSTLRGALDWSWDLLSPRDKSALAQLSVFEGGFTLADAEAVLDLSVCGADPWVLDAVQSLLEKSMVRSLGEDRFDLLRSVQEYASEHLGAAHQFDGSGAALRLRTEARHWHYFATFDERAATADGCAAADNLIAACRRAGSAGDAAAAAGALEGAWAVLRLTGPFRVALDLGERLRLLPEVGDAQRMTIDRIVGNALETLGDVDLARQRFDSALAAARLTGSRKSEALALCALGEHLYKRGHPDASREHLLQSHRIAAELGLSGVACSALNALGTLDMRQGRIADAKLRYEAALALARASGDLRTEGGVRGNLAMVACASAAYDDARRQFEQALLLANQVRDRQWEGNTRCNLGLLQHEQGRSGEARLQFQLALAIARELGHARLEATVLCNIGISLEARDELADACGHYEAAVAVAHRLQDPRAEGQFRGHLGQCRAKLGLLAEASVELAAGEALLREVADPTSLALLLCQRAGVEHLADRSGAARSTLARAQSAAGDVVPDSELGRVLARTRDLLSDDPA